ncbi:uncharacterized protein V6R79_000948 [Siganus canaliculatus]
MAAALPLVLMGCLVQGSMSRKFKVTMPETMSVLSGSCVTIPCGFDTDSQHAENVDETCRAMWKAKDSVVFDSSAPQQSKIKGTFQGNLQSKNCTTTLNSMEPQHGNEYVFRLECNNRLKWNYRQQILNISVKDEPPSLTLSPNTLEVTEGTTVRLTCSAPAPCPSHPPALSWSPRVGEGQETLQVNPDKTEFKMSVVNFRASFLDHGQNISCTAVYPKQNGSEVSVSAELTARVLIAPQILASSDCTKSAQQLNCSCETVGNPAPTLQWRLNGESVNQSDGFSISTERLNATSLRSIISVSEPQRTDLSTLLCHSSNSQGSATQRLCIYSLKPQAAAGMITLPVFITTVGILLLIPCVLLLVIRVQKTHCSGHDSAATEPRLSVLEDNTYENVNVLNEAHATYHRTAQGQRTGPAFKQR